MRLGIVIFRWAALVSPIVSFVPSLIRTPSFRSIPDVALALMRSVSLLELCLLAFLCLCMNALRLSFATWHLAFRLGFGFMSANDFCSLR